MTTTMLTSTSIKAKKKVSSSSKPYRSSSAETLKRNPKAELKKSELIQLLGRFEAELQAKDIVLATLKSEKVRLLVSNARLGRLDRQTDPYIALFRDGEQVKNDPNSEQTPIKNTRETQVVQLIGQQKKQVEVLKTALEMTQKRCLLLIQELENEKRAKVRLQAFQDQLLVAEEEKSQLRNDLDQVKFHNKELEQQLIQIMKLFEDEHERHKKFVILFLNDRKLENEYHQEQLKQLSNHQMNDDTQREVKFKELELENERNKQMLTERIIQLQNEIDLLVEEKKQRLTLNNSLPLNDRGNESIPKAKSKIRQLPSTDSSSVREIASSTNDPSPSVNAEKLSSSVTTTTTKSGVHSSTPTQTSSSKNNVNLSTKASVTSTSISTRTQQSSLTTKSTSTVPTVAKRNGISTRSTSTVSQKSIASNSMSSTTRTNLTRDDGIPDLTKNRHQIIKATTSTASSKRTDQTSFSSEHKTDDIRTLLETIRTVAENRLKSQTAMVDSSPITNQKDSETTSLSSDSHTVLFRTAEVGDADQLFKFLKLGCNANSQMIDGNTCLHISTAHGHIQCLRHLLQFGANPYLENNLGTTSWKNLSQLDETIELECLYEFVNHGQHLPPVDLIFNAIERNHIKTYDYLLSLSHEQLKTDFSSLSRLLRTALRSSDTHFLECLFAIVTVQDFIQLIDPNTFISSECLSVLSSLENEETHSKPIHLTVCIASSNREHRFSYAIGVISVTANMSWLELERSCSKIFIDHITQLDSPFDYEKSSTGCATNNIDTLTLGLTKWHYQDSPNDDSLKPFTVAREQNTIIIHLKGIDLNSTDSLAYNYFIPSQNLKTFIRYIEQHVYVGVYGAAYFQKKSLFEDIMRYFERPTVFSTTPKFRVIRFEFESVTSLDDCIDELVEQDFLRTNPWPTDNLEGHHSTKVLLYFANVQQSSGSEMMNLLLTSESVSDTCRKLIHSREDDLDSTMTYYFPSIFHIFVTLSKRATSTENELYKKFKWIPFKIDSAPWNGLLKRHLWRRMIDINTRENRSVDHELIKTLQWVTNVWQRYNECLQKLSLQDASLGPALFFDCPMEREAIFEWLQTKWNSIIAPLVREYSMNKCTQPKSKYSKTNASFLQANSLEVDAPYEATACRALYVLLQRAVSRDCPLTGQEREQYLLEFVGSRVEGGGGGSSSTISSAASSRAGTPQLSGNSDFVSIQLE